MNTARKSLRRMLEGDEIVVAPGAHDCLSARIIEAVGFKAVYGTGYGASASFLGRPDVGLMTFTEMVVHMHNLAEATGLPVIADADTGYGNAINVMRTLREYELAGVAAIQLEDQVMPKKCGHMSGREIIPMEEMVGKIKAAVVARQDPDLVIIARTDARTVHGIEEAVRRGQAYARAGADVVFIESPESVEEMNLINSSIPVPTLANMVERGKTPLMPVRELQALGYKLAIFPVTSVLAQARTLFSVFRELFEKGSTNHLLDQHLYGFEDFNQLMGVDVVRDLEKRFLPEKDGAGK